MKKTLLPILLVILCFGCSDDEDGPLSSQLQNDIQGTWVVTGSKCTFYNATGGPQHNVDYLEAVGWEYAFQGNTLRIKSKSGEVTTLAYTVAEVLGEKRLTVTTKDGANPDFEIPITILEVGITTLTKDVLDWEGDAHNIYYYTHTGPDVDGNGLGDETVINQAAKAVDRLKLVRK